MLLELKRIHLPPGQTVILQDVTWTELETILEELGEHRAARIAYDKGRLEIMAPLPEHEDDKEIISDLVKALLVSPTQISPTQISPTQISFSQVRYYIWIFLSPLIPKLFSLIQYC